MLNFINKRMKTAVVVAVATKINKKEVIYDGALFDWVLNTPMQTDTLVTMRKENIGSLQSTRCNEVWNRRKDK